MERDLLLELFQRVTGLYFGKYRGEVVSNGDSTNRGRLQVKVPSLLGDAALWALPCVPYAGDQVGFYSLPPEKSGVWVEFEGGHLDFPIWSGCYWRDNELPDTGGAAMKYWQTDKVKVHVDDDKDELVLQTSNDTTVTAGKDKVETKVGSIKHTVATAGVTSDAGTGKIEVTSSSVSVNSGALQVS